MYLRDLIKIGLPTFPADEPCPQENSLFINKINQDEDRLIVEVSNKNETSVGNAYISLKSYIDKKLSILEKIKSSEKVIGKTLSELIDTKLENL